MTFILNILHKDMSILAADTKAVADWPTIFGFPTRGKAVNHNQKKITMNKTGQLAIGVAGYSEHNSYIGEFEKSEIISEGLSIIRKHMERFLLVDDLASLIKSASPFANECIASFYDKSTQTYFTNEFSFNQYQNKTHLHRASDGVKLFCAGSGGDYFDLESGVKEVQSLIESNDISCLQEVCIAWIENIFKFVSSKDECCGSKAIFSVSSRTKNEFQTIERSCYK